MLRDRIVDELQRFFAAHARGLVAAYLFGSVARGQARADSDVDVGVVLGARPPFSLADLDRLAAMQDELARQLQRDVDLIPLDMAAPDLLHRVLVDKVLVFDGDPDRRIEFEVRARNEYFDIAPHLAQYRRTVLRRA